jgi:archaellin
MAVSVTATAGSDQVEISGRTVKVKDAWNASGISYTLPAFT